MEEIVLTLLGRDQPGIVQAVARSVAAHEGNWLESRMARLGGQFAGILRVEVPIGKASVLRTALENVADGLAVVVASGDSGHAPRETRAFSVELLAQDRPGLVREISQAMARRGANVEELTTHRFSAAMSGDTLFAAHAKITLRDADGIDELRTELEKLAADLMVEISVEEHREEWDE